MQILLISECSKQALTETRRILDQFACRLGQRTWQTSITQEGLNTLRMLLRRTARKNTAVACHWVKQGGQSELLWIVGNLRCFDEHGRVPTDTSHRNILRSRDENDWSSAESLALMAAIAGLFHYFVKANRMFQHKLLPGAGLKAEPVRHEWVSLCLFAAFVDQQADSAWLQRLAEIQPADEAGLLAKFASRKAQAGWASGAAPLAQLRGLARVVGWLIVTHHRLPAIPSSEKMCAPEQAMIGDGVQPSRFHAGWNSPQLISRTDWREQDHRDVWSFDAGTPCSSARWCDKARQIGRRALQHSSLMAVDWLEQDAFTCHLARLALMLADHSYSAGPATPKWQDPDYAAWANTSSAKDGGPQVRKQKLDEHNAGVAHNALLLARKLPLLRRDLPAISRHRLLKKRTTQSEFQWQNRAYDLAAGVAAISRSQGFFGVNMASTGKGKTFANARIMYGLADERVGCRFSVALGLRTLTLQTGDALRSRLQLEPDELAVLIGSQAVLDLHQSNHDRRQASAEPVLSLSAGGSESSAELVDDGQHVFFAGSLNEGPIRRWLASDRESKASALISAPVLVCTIDHLIGATESGRGGRQIAPMLRLLTADLVLDEPDDFDLADLPALCRLVNWAGMLGSRVLLSS